ncbi:S-layer homology domain-containing protein [Patescibacteria group bacterium]
MKKLYIIAAFIASAIIILGTVIPQKGEDYNLREDTIFKIVHNLIDQGLLTKPDLAIDKVEIHKLENPSSQQPYYRYNADIFIKNNGGNIRSATVTLEDNNSDKPFLLRNSGSGFTLEKEEIFILRDYKLIFDGRLNVGEIELSLQVPSELDSNKENNYYQIDFQEFPAKLADIRIEELFGDGTLMVGYETDDYVKRNFQFEVYTSQNAKFPNHEMEYFEIDYDKKIFDYYRATSSMNNFQENDWERQKDTYFNTQYYNINGKITKDKSLSFFIKAEDPETGAYAVSDILHFQKSEGINRGELAKLLIVLTNTKIYDKGEIYYNDISKEDWFFPYVQTLYNLGVTDLETTNFYPEEDVLRGDFLKLAIEFFDIDLVSREKIPRFKDIPVDHDLFHYTQAFYASGGAKNLAPYFRPELKANLNFLNYFIQNYVQTY